MPHVFSRIYNTLFAGKSGFKRYAANTGWLLGARAVQMVVALVIGAMVARYLGPQEYGIYSYIISYVAIFSVLSPLGTNNILVKDLLNDPEKKEVLMGTGLAIRIAGSLLAVILIAMASAYTESDNAVRWFLFLASLQPLVRSVEVISLYFQAKVVSRFTVIAQLVSLTCISLVKIYLVVEAYPLVYFICLFAIDSAITGSVLLLFYRRMGNGVRSMHFSWPVARSLISRSWPLIFSGMLTTVYLKVDQVMLQHLMDETAVGLYAAAVKISESWITIPWILSGSLYPALVNAYKEDNVLFINRIRQMYILLIAVALSVIIPVCIFSKFIILLIFGGEYSGSFSTLQIHIFSTLFIFFGSVSNRWLILDNNQRFWMINSATGAVVNIALNLYLIPIFGINGAAIATLISYAFAYYFAYAIPKATRKIFFEQNKSLLRVILVLPAIRELKKIKFR